jgi:hypothetical protein
VSDQLHTPAALTPGKEAKSGCGRRGVNKNLTFLGTEPWSFSP